VRRSNIAEAVDMARCWLWNSGSSHWIGPSTLRQGRTDWKGPCWSGCYRFDLGCCALICQVSRCVIVRNNSRWHLDALAIISLPDQLRLFLVGSESIGSCCCCCCYCCFCRRWFGPRDGAIKNWKPGRWHKHCESIALKSRLRVGRIRSDGGISCLFACWYPCWRGRLALYRRLIWG
jgi:hypothetical protein